MERMDRYRRIGGWLWVASGLVVQVVGLLTWRVQPGPVTWVFVAAVTVLATVLLLRPGDTAAWLLARGVAVLLAMDLVGAVLDRFGVLGGPGSPGVSWGDWDGFESYTAVLLHDPGSSLVTVVAAGATLVEVVLATALAAGRQSRWTGKALAGLFVIYLVAMVLSPARGDVLRYGVPVLIGGALLVSSVPSRETMRPDAYARETARA